VSGIVLSDGTPVAGAIVHLHHALATRQCGPYGLSATTDAAGGFSFQGRKELELLVVAGDRLDRWAMCIEANGQFFEGCRAIGIGHPPQRISFTCELQATSRPAPRGKGICRPGT
jgi:hypothetical protein